MGCIGKKRGAMSGVAASGFRPGWHAAGNRAEGLVPGAAD
jgi:hypothetical protein